MKSKFASYISLFASTGTLFCCALPSLLVVLGMGATMAGLVSAVPQIIWLSTYKAYVFAFSGIMLSVAAYFQYQSRFEPCPTDPELAASCDRARKVSLGILVFSGTLWLVGFYFAFLAIHVH